MRLRLCIPALVLCLAFPLIATAQTTEPPEEPQPAVFCQQSYALCIKAPCTPIVTRKTDGSYEISQANCLCEVVPGWSMGPKDCQSRAPQTIKGRTYLVSTYSNFFNETNLTLSCPDKDTLWAWCYGSPCIVDEKNPNKSMCTCPVKRGPTMTLGGGCRKEACNEIWSGARPKNDDFANSHFYQYGTENKFQPPPNPPAKDCPPTGTPATTTTTTSSSN